jgi:hypothetical protein
MKKSNEIIQGIMWECVDYIYLTWDRNRDEVF